MEGAAMAAEATTAGQNLVEVGRIRKNFQETWIWSKVDIE
jgi:hypothetical protein